MSQLWEMVALLPASLHELELRFVSKLRADDLTTAESARFPARLHRLLLRAELADSRSAVWRALQPLLPAESELIFSRLY